MKNFLAIFFCLTISISAFSQQRGGPKPQVTITGKVIDIETKEPLEYATIVLKPLNGKQLSGGITDSSGNFSIQVAKGKYDVSVEFISFKTKEFKNQTLSENMNLGTISLSIDAQALDEVEIIAEKSTVEIRLDKKIYNVGKDMTVRGGSASDVLDNVPSVTVDIEGNVSLRGNDNVRILVNGKPSGLIGLSGADALKQLPADAIQKVEVITSPSARYDAEGTGGILNIVLRKGKAQGFNGSFSANAGIPDNFGGSANLNYRVNKVNFFTNTGYRYSNSPGESYNNVIYYDEFQTPISYRNEVTDYNRKRNRFNTQIGMEYYLSDKSSLTGTFFYRNSKGDNLSENYTDDLDAMEVLTSQSTRINDEKDDGQNIEYSLNYTQEFDKAGHELIIDVQYSDDRDSEKSLISDFDTFPSYLDNNPERNSTIDKSKDFLFKGDYVFPISEKSQFEFGLRADLNQLNSDYLVEDFNPDTGEFENNTNFSNTLDFEQNVYSVYAQYGTKFNELSMLFGLRSETTNRTINLIQTDELYKKDFTELFPTVNLGYEFSESSSLTLGYNRRLRRPRSYFLNPFESRTSETYIRKGNVNLDPTYTNSFNLGYLKRWPKFTLNSSMYFQHAINNIEFVQTEELREVNGEPTLVIVRMPINLSSRDRYGFEFTANWTPFKWWRISQSFNFFRSITDGFYDGISYDADNTSWFTRLNSTITLPGKIDWQTRAMYRGPSKTAQTNRDGMISVNLAFSKDLLKEKATISFTISDLLNSRKRKGTTTTLTTYSEGEFQWRQRQFMLNFTYRFNQKKKRQRSGNGYGGGGEEEMFKA